MQTEILVVGCGVIGLAVTRRLSQRFQVIAVEQMDTFGKITSSRNSSVIHSGIYYPNESLKTKLCIQGNRMMYEYLEKKRVEFKRIGKWVVGDPNQTEELRLKAKGLGVVADYTKVDLKPCKFKRALQVNETGIMDVYGYMQALETDALERADILYNARVAKVTRDSNGFTVDIEQNNERFELKAGMVINCAGLESKLISKPVKDLGDLKYCKGHYFGLRGHRNLVPKLIYPLPDKNLQSFGVHLTLDLQGQVKFGPDTFYQDSFTDYDFIQDPTHKKRFHDNISTYLDISIDDLYPDYTGIRYLLNLQRPKLDSEKFSDFFIENHDGMINLCGIESPGLTSSLAIAEHVNKMI